MSTPEFPSPTWATDDVWTSGPDVGQPTKLKPVAGAIAQGWSRGLKPPADWMNWILNALCEWLGYTIRSPVLNFDGAYADDTGTPFDTSYLRADGTNGAFWDPVLIRWVLAGSDTAGSFYAGDDQRFHKIATGVGSPPKTSFGCSSSGSVILVNSDILTGGGTGPSFIRSTDMFETTWAKDVLPGSFAGERRAQDAIDVAGTAMVCGGGDGNHLVWTSSNGGATWTKVVVGASADSATFLSRIILGKNGRLFAWANATTLNGGNKLWYSDDTGATWTATGALGFDSILSGVYLAGHDRYIFCSGTHLYIAADPTTLVFTDIDTGFAITALGGTDYWGVAGLERTSGLYYLLMSDDLFTTNHVIKRDTSDNPITCIALRSDSAMQLLARSGSGGAAHTSARW